MAERMTTIGCALVITLAVIVLSGCMRPPVSGGGTPIPLNQQGVPLVAYMREGTHGRGQGVYLYPNASAPGPAPASCIAYRASMAGEGDTCTVSAERSTLPSAREAPWTIRAFWRTNEPTNFTVAAFDGGGRQVGWWAGAQDPNMAYITE